MNSTMNVCPGCGLELPKSNYSLPEKFHASAECWEKFQKLSECTIPLYDEEFIHQMAIDTYEAQHGGGETKNITVTFGLIGLYLSLEKKYSGREVQRAHMILANHNKNWPRFEPPTYKWSMTVNDVLMSESSLYKEKIQEWARVTWSGWEKEREVIVELVEKYLYKD